MPILVRAAPSPGDGKAETERARRWLAQCARRAAGAPAAAVVRLRRVVQLYTVVLFSNEKLSVWPQPPTWTILTLSFLTLRFSQKLRQHQKIPRGHFTEKLRNIISLKTLVIFAECCTPKEDFF